MTLIDALYLYEELAGYVLWSIAFGVFAALSVAAFSLGGAWALRGRPALATPRCSRCGSSLRALGTELPSNCPECGTSLASARSVRWLRFRRQVLTAGLTAPVVWLGGLTIGLVVAAWVVTTARDHLLRRTPIVATKDVDATVPPTQHVELDSGADAWLGRPVREILALPGASVDPYAIASTASWVYQSRCRRERYALPTAGRLLDAIEIAAFVEAEARRYWTTPNQPDRATLGLAMALVLSGDASPAWFARVNAPPDVSQSIRLLAPHSVQAGAPMMLRIVDVDPSAPTRKPGSFWIDDASGTAADGTPVLFDRIHVHRGFHSIPETAPKTLGPIKIAVTWRDGVYQTGGIAEAVVDVTARDTRLPRHPIDPKGLKLSVHVWPLGARDAIEFAASDSNRNALLGTWSIEIDGRWVPMPLTAADWSFVTGGVITGAPRTPWGERAGARVRFVPFTDDEIRTLIPTLPTDVAGQNALTMNASLPSEPIEIELSIPMGSVRREPFTFIAW